MRFLKKKIALKQESTEANADASDAPDAEVSTKTEIKAEPQVKEEDIGQSAPQQLQSKKTEKIHEESKIVEDILPLRGPRKNRTPATADSKNIVKNYGKALCAFASSKLAVPYLENIILKNGYDQVDIKQFMETMKQKKETTNSMESLRRLLMEEDDDTEDEKEQKLLFKEVSIIFMKYFSVNWIYSGKLVHKNAHLNFRFKMLRRIQKPEHFTYLKTSAKS